MFDLLLFLAQQAPAKPEEAPPPWMPFIPMIAILLLFYFLLYLPMRRRERQEREALNSAMKKNDKVLTSGGIIGVISYINEKDNEVTLRLEEGKVKVLKTAIVQILQPSEGPKETAQESGSK